MFFSLSVGTPDREISLCLYSWKKMNEWYRMVGSFVEKTD